MAHLLWNNFGGEGSGVPAVAQLWMRGKWCTCCGTVVKAREVTYLLWHSCGGEGNGVPAVAQLWKRGKWQTQDRQATDGSSR